MRYIRHALIAPLLAVALVATPAAADPTSSDSSSGSGQRTVGWITMGVGGACLVSAGALFARYYTRDRGSDDAREYSDSLDSYRTSGQVLGAIGLAAFGGGVALVLTAPNEERTVAVSAGPGQITVGTTF